VSGIRRAQRGKGRGQANGRDLNTKRIAKPGAGTRKGEEAEMRVLSGARNPPSRTVEEEAQGILPGGVRGSVPTTRMRSLGEEIRGLSQERGETTPFKVHRRSDEQATRGKGEKTFLAEESKKKCSR